MFNGQPFLNGLLQGGQPQQQQNSGMQGGGPSASGPMGMSDAMAQNPQLQALLQQQQMQQMRWQQRQNQPQASPLVVQPNQQQTPQTPQLQQNMPSQQGTPGHPQQPPPPHQFFNPAAFLNQAAGGNAMLSQQQGLQQSQQSGMQTLGMPQTPSQQPMMQSGQQPQQPQPQPPQNPAAFNQQALMASLGSLNPQQIQALLAASRAHASNPADGSQASMVGQSILAAMQQQQQQNQQQNQSPQQNQGAGPHGGNLMGSMNPAAMMAQNPMLQQMQAAAAAAQGQSPAPNMNFAQQQMSGMMGAAGPSTGSQMGPGGQFYNMPNGMGMPNQQQQQFMPPPPQQQQQTPLNRPQPMQQIPQRPSTSASTSSAADPNGSPAKEKKGKATKKQSKGSLKSEARSATPVPATNASGTASPHGTTGQDPRQFRSPSIQSARGQIQPSATPAIGGAGPSLHPPDRPPPQMQQQQWRPSLALEQQQQVMTKALEYAHNNNVNPGDVLAKMNLIYVKADQLPVSTGGVQLSNGTVVLTMDEARMFGVMRPRQPGQAPDVQGQGQGPAMAPGPNGVHGGPFPPGAQPLPGAPPMGSPAGSMPPQSPAVTGPNRRQPTAPNGRPESRQGPLSQSSMPPPVGPGQLQRRPSGAPDQRQQSVDSMGRPPQFGGPHDMSSHLQRRPSMQGSMPPTPVGGPASAPGQGHPPFGPGFPGMQPNGPPRPNPNLPPVHGGALPPTTARGHPVSGMNTRVTALPNLDRPSITQDDLNGAVWQPMSEKDEEQLLDIMKADAAYESLIQQHMQKIHGAIRQRIDAMHPLARRRGEDGSLVHPEHLHWWERPDDEDPHLTGDGFFKIVFPEERKAELREKRGGRSATTSGFMERLKRKQLVAIGEKFEELIPIRLEIDHEGWKLRDTFIWNASDDLTSYDEFSRNLCEDYGLPEASFVPLVREAITTQIAEHAQAVILRPQSTLQSKARDRGDLSEEDVNWWARWRESVKQLEEDAWKGEKIKLHLVEWDSESDKTAATSVSSKAQDAELRIQIKLDITVGAMNLVDQFDWDILDESASPEHFAAAFSADLGLSGEFKTAIAHSIREQVDVHIRSLALVGHIFDGSSVSDDELKGAFLPSIGKGALSVTRIGQEIEDHTPKLLQLSEAEVDQLEKERERDNKRKRRQPRGRRGINLPDREPLKTQRTPAIGGLQAAQIEAAGGAAAVAAAAGASNLGVSELTGVRQSTRRAAAAANAHIQAQSEFDHTPTPAPEMRASVAPGPAGVKRQRLEDYDVHFKYPGGLGRDETGEGPRFAPSSDDFERRISVATASAAAAAHKARREDGGRQESPTKDFKTASSSSASTPKISRAEEIASQHPNIHDGQWYCSNCGIPGWLTLGRRKGPLGEKSLCGPCGKFWHRFKRIKVVQYTRDEGFHRRSGLANTNGLAMPPAGLGGLGEDSSAVPTPRDGALTPNTRLDLSTDTSMDSPDAAGTSSAMRPSASRNKEAPSTRAASPDLPFQRVGSPSDSESDHSQSPRASRRSSPRKGNSGATPSVAGLPSARGLSRGLSRGLTPNRERSEAGSSHSPSKLGLDGTVPLPSTSQPSLASPVAASVPLPSSSSMLSATSPTTTTPPEWLSTAAASLRAAWPNDRFELRPKGVGEWRLRCTDCPGKLYTPGPGESLTNFEVHLKNRAHRSNVNARLEKGG